MLRHEEEMHVAYEFHPYQLSVIDFCTGAKELRSCSRMTGEHTNEFGYFRGSAEWICDEPTIAQLAARKDFTGLLFRRAQQYRIAPAEQK